MTELKDKRLEAAQEIAEAMLAEVRVHVTQGRTQIDACVIGALDTALRVTGADELAEALEACLRCELYERDYVKELATSALARYKELKHG